MGTFVLEFLLACVKEHWTRIVAMKFFRKTKWTIKHDLNSFSFEQCPETPGLEVLPPLWLFQAPLIVAWSEIPFIRHQNPAPSNSFSWCFLEAAEREMAAPSSYKFLATPVLGNKQIATIAAKPS